jgi:hypothetical protein
MISALSIGHHESTVKMLTSIMAVFALFWLPGQVMAFLLEFENENEFILNYGLDIGYIFVFTNCVMNPLIFAYFSQCHRRSPRRLTVTSINPTIACELGFSTFRRESDVDDSIKQKRRASLPGNLKRLPLARTLKRPSLPVLHQHKDITEEQKEDILQQTGTDRDTLFSKRKNSILPQKTMPVLVEAQKSDVIPSDQTTEYQQRLQNSDPQTDVQKHESLSSAASAQQKGASAHNIENRTQKRGPGSRKRLSFSIQREDTSHTTQNNNNSIPNYQKDMRAIKQTDSSEERDKRPDIQTQKRPSFSILKTRESLSTTQRDSILGNQSEKHGDVDVGVMKNFLEIMKTMREDVLRKYLDATPETVLN